jgi:hypothetical protein
LHSGISYGQRLSRPISLFYGRVIAFGDITGRSELVQLNTFAPAACCNRKHQKPPAVLPDALQHVPESWGEFQGIRHESGTMAGQGWPQ